jgi:uncharacterized protein
VTFRGHPMVRSLHPTTIEVTTDEHLTVNGDCILGVAADKGCAGLSEAVREALKVDGAPVTIKLVAGSLSFSVRASGDARLELTHPADMVLRKSDFISDRTLAVRADAAAKDLPRNLVDALKDPRTVGYLEIEVG